MTRPGKQRQTIGAIVEGSIDSETGEVHAYPGWAHQIPHLHKRYENGEQLAALDALVCCSVAQQAPPHWVAEGIAYMVSELLTSAKWNSRGQEPALKQFQRYFAKMEQLNAYQLVRQAQGKEGDNPEEAALWLNHSYNYTFDENCGRNVEHALEIVQQIFAGSEIFMTTPAAVSKIRKSTLSHAPLLGLTAELMGLTVHPKGRT